MKRFRLPNPKLSAARAEAWKTRRQKYGPRGHSGSYSRVAVRDDVRLSRLVAVLWGDEVLSEGQLARILELDVVEVRRLVDDGFACLRYRPLTGTWGGHVMDRLHAAHPGRMETASE